MNIGQYQYFVGQDIGNTNMTCSLIHIDTNMRIYRISSTPYMCVSTVRPFSRVQRAHNTHEYWCSDPAEGWVLGAPAPSQGWVLVGAECSSTQPRLGAGCSGTQQAGC